MNISMECYLQKNGDILDFQKNKQKLKDVWEWEMRLRKGVTFDSVMKAMLNCRESVEVLMTSIANGNNPMSIPDEWFYLKDKVKPLTSTDEEFIDYIKIRWIAEEMETSKATRLDIFSMMVGVFKEEYYDDIRYITLMSPARLQQIPIILDTTIKFYDPKKEQHIISYSMPMKTKDIFQAIIKEFTYYGDTFERHIMRICFEKILRGSKLRNRPNQ